MVEPATIATAFIILGILLLLIEAAMPGFFIAVPATVLVLLGLIAFAVPEFDLFSWQAPALAFVIGLPATVLTILAYRKMAPATAPPTTMSGDRLVGRECVVTRAIEPTSSKGKVRLGLEEWSATADAPIEVGARVRIERVDGVILRVAAVEPL
ncbi:MAG TPA: NfeD family protein [Candidatus Thermoplasmatota archaeon]|nr:NfeD family protein [Candidatus Thermoplasmatota archaeon]